MIFCNRCLEVFYDGITNYIDEKCAKANCTGTLIKVDEMIGPIIIYLFSKGYRCIESSCSGHPHRPHTMTYIRFNAYSMVEDCPEGFDIVFDAKGTLIKKHILSNDILQRQAMIIEAILHLRTWVNNLEICDD